MKNMKTIKNAVAACIALLIVSCGTTPEGDGTLTFVEVDGNELTICHFDKVTDTIDINLSDLVEDYKIVRFENSDKALFNTRAYPVVVDNYIGIRSFGTQPYLLFNHDGTLKCNVGSIGGGPGEYDRNIYDEAINEKTGEIYLAPSISSKILVYNTDGEFLREITLEDRLNKPKIEVDNDGNITILHMPFDKEKTFAVQYNKDGMLKQELKAAPQLVVKDYNSDMFAYHNVPEFSFWLTSCDTLFHYDKKENKIYPKFTMDFGEVDEIPFHVYNEIPSHYIISAPKGVVAVDKKARTSNYVKLKNDFFGHLRASMFNINNGWFFQVFEPGSLITRIERRLAESDCSAEDRKQLEEMLNSINEDDNNIMFIGKLK